MHFFAANLAGTQNNMHKRSNQESLGYKKKNVNCDTHQMCLDHVRNRESAVILENHVDPYKCNLSAI